MARITVEDCVAKIPNKFQLVLVAAKRARQLAKLYGERFEPTPRLVEMAEKGESFPA